MWIEELPNGKYKYIERYEDPLTGKLKRVSVIKPNKTRQTQKEASYILNNKIATKIREIKSKPKEINSLIYMMNGSIAIKSKWLRVRTCLQITL